MKSKSETPRAARRSGGRKSVSAQLSQSPKSIDKIVDLFVLEIDSLANTLPLAMKSIALARDGAGKELDKFARDYGKPTKDGLGIQFDIEHGEKLRKLSDDLRRALAAAVLVPRSFLVSLISQYDNYLGQMIETLLLSKPEIVNGSERTLSFQELSSFGSIQEALECPANSVPVGVRQTGMEGARNGQGKEAHA